MASGSFDKSIEIWDIVTGAYLKKLEGHTEMVSSVIFSPDSQCLASGSIDETVMIWDIMTGAYLKILKGHTKMVYSVVFSIDS